MSVTESLPHVDEHAARVGAGAELTWEALLRVLERSVSAAGASGFARALGCSDTVPAGPRPLTTGSTIPGFRVEGSEPQRELALVGRHRFSEYALIFRLDDLGAGETRLRAETRAVFPGLKGRAYRALVIGTRAHVVVTRRLLGATKRRAERGSGDFRPAPER